MKTMILMFAFFLLSGCAIFSPAMQLSQDYVINLKTEHDTVGIPFFTVCNYEAGKLDGLLGDNADKPTMDMLTEMKNICSAPTHSDQQMGKVLILYGRLWEVVAKKGLAKIISFVSSVAPMGEKKPSKGP